MGAAFSDVCALWVVAALLVGALLLARDEWRLRQRGKDNGHE